MKDSLQKYAIDVNNLLTEYIILHDALQKKTNSIFGIFRSINFDELYKTSQEIQGKLKNITSEIEDNSRKITTDYENEFVNCLLDYSKALSITLDLFIKMLFKLSQKSSGEKLSFKEHMENSNKYKESITNYQIIGEKLNNLYKNL